MVSGMQRSMVGGSRFLCRVCLVAATLFDCSSSRGLLQARRHISLASAARGTVRLDASGGNKSEEWHNNLGKGLAQEHNPDTEGGQTNATFAADKSIEQRVLKDTRPPEGYNDIEPEFIKVPKTTVAPITSTQAPSAQTTGSSKDSINADDVSSTVEEERGDAKKNGGQVEAAGGEQTSEKEPDDEPGGEEEASGHGVKDSKENKPWLEKKTGVAWLSWYWVLVVLAVLLVICCLFACCVKRDEKSDDKVDDTGAPLPTPSNHKAEDKTDDNGVDDNEAVDNDVEEGDKKP